MLNKFLINGTDITEYVIYHKIEPLYEDSGVVNNVRLEFETKDLSIKEFLELNNLIMFGNSVMLHDDECFVNMFIDNFSKFSFVNVEEQKNIKAELILRLGHQAA